jgi:hypothetical protein
MPKLIPVGNEFAIVDDDDFEELSKHHWYSGGSHGLYAIATINGEIMYMHRLLLNAQKPLIVDHINGSTCDNRRANLRLCMQRENMANQRKQLIAKNDRVTTSKYKGVFFRKDRNRWSAYIGTGKDREWLGCFATQEAAALAYNKAAKERWGEFSKINIINDDVY